MAKKKTTNGEYIVQDDGNGTWMTTNKGTNGPWVFGGLISEAFRFPTRGKARATADLHYRQIRHRLSVKEAPPA